MATATKENPCRVITPLARLSYPYLFKPSEGLDDGEAKYQCELIFPADADLSELKQAAQLAIKAKWGDKPPTKLKNPFRNGDEDREGKDGYEGSIFIGARSKDKPGVVIGRDRIPCSSESDVYGGCYVKCSVTAFAYDHPKGGRGVSFALNNVWKIRDGEPFGSRKNAEEEFEGEQLDESAFGSSIDDESPF